MPGTLVPLISRCDRASALARIDTAAVELMTEGRAATLSAARIDAIRTRLSRQHAELVALIDELAARPSTGNGRVDALNADLGVEATKALAQVELFMRQAEICARPE